MFGEQKILTCFSGSIFANPPECDDFPPFDAISRTSSVGRLAKLEGLVFEDMMVLRLK